jgi:hyperosmotically inducible periplasmic protein
MTMNQSTNKFLAAALLGVALAAAGCSSSPTRESTGEYIDDTALTTRVKAKFVEDKTVSAGAINVETFKGVVQLSGFANSQAEANQAVALAQSTSGVKSVKNDIRLK